MTNQIDPNAPSPISQPPDTPTPAVEESTTTGVEDTIQGSEQGEETQGSTPGAITNPALPKPKFSLIEFSRIVQEAISELREQLYSDDVNDPKISKKFRKAAAKTAKSLRDLRNQVRASAVNYADLYEDQVSQIASYNGSAQTYNTGISPGLTQENQQIAQMNQAIQDYNSGLLTDEQFNQIANAFNTYVNSRNAEIQGFVTTYNAAATTYNAQVDANNVTIKEYNKALKKLGLPTIPKQIPVSLASLLSTQPLAPPIGGQFTNAYIPRESLATVNAPNEYINFASDQNIQIEAINSYIDAYNNSISPAVINEDELTEIEKDDEQTDLINKAIKDYNKGLITDEEFNAAAAAYNNYVNGRNPALQSPTNILNQAIANYNLQVHEKNLQIDQLNIERAANGDPLIPYLDELPLATLMPTVMSAPPPAGEFEKLPSRHLYDNESSIANLLDQNSVTNEFVNPIIDAAMNSMLSFNEKLDRSNAFFEKLKFNLRSNVIIFPNAYINRKPRASFGSSGTAGAAAAFGGQLLGLDTPSLEAKMSQALFTATNLDALRNLPDELFKEIDDFRALLTNNAAILSSKPALQSVSDRIATVNLNGTAVNTAAAASFASNILGIVGNNQIRENLEEILTSQLAGSDITPEQLSVLIDNLTATVNLSLLENALSQVAISLGLPGLIPQILGNVPGIETGALLVASSRQEQLNEVLADPIRLTALSASLAESLPGQEALIDRALDLALAQGKFSSDSAFRRTLIEKLNNVGIGGLTAVKVANEAVELLRGEILLQTLDLEINNAIVQGNLEDQRVLFDEIINKGIKEDGVKQAVIRAQEKADELRSNRDFRDQLIKELQQEGLARVDAIRFSNTITDILNRGIKDDAIRADTIRQDILLESLNTPNAQNVIDRTFASGPFADTVAFKEALKQELLAEGLLRDEAREIAENAIIERQAEINQLSDGGFVSALPLTQLAEQLEGLAVGKLTGSDELSANKAEELSNRLLVTLFGARNAKELDDEALKNPVSILSQLDEQIKVLQKEATKEKEEILAENFRELINPHVSVFDLHLKTLLPANYYIKTQAWGIMYQGVPQPDDWKKSIDIIV